MMTLKQKHSGLQRLALLAALTAGSTVLLGFAADAEAREPANAPPALIITNEPLPRDLKDNVYSKPVQVREIKPRDIKGNNYYDETNTLVARKIDGLQDDLYDLQSRVASLSSTLASMQRLNEEKSAEYYAAVATINTQLQSGTTPGNPRLLKRISQAEVNLENLAQSVAQLNQMAIELAHSASEGSFLLESTRATYGLAGAVEEDHVRLAELEDVINNTLVVIERLLDNVNDDITRTSTYLSSERHNLRTLSLAVTNGDLYGKSLSNKPFSNVGPFSASTPPGAAAVPSAGEAFGTPTIGQNAALGSPRPLVKIRFDRPNVEYEQPVYMAVNEALQRFPGAQFDLVAVHPTQGNAAEVAIESTRARRNAERVLRTLTQMGLPLDRVNLSYNESTDARSSEVHLFVR